MPTDDLRERLADAFQRDVDLDALKPKPSCRHRGEMDALSAYELADVALGVVEGRCGPDHSRPNTVVIAESSYDQDIDECPECQARPNEPCIVEIAIMQGFPDETPMCPRDA